ncbi:phage terminase large subunit family protein [Candidatus Enterovibrio escicola]|uniref:phage terminase large subunit family protein n=1 Tax=Candidatus Enterovibrio escicola TaxID=1927127 RepID=UPI0016814CDE
MVFVLVIAPLFAESDCFMILEKHNWRGLNFQYQLDQIDDFCARYNVTHIGIDTMCVSLVVWDFVYENQP